MEKYDVHKNGSGYYDPTAYRAIKNIDCESHFDTERFHKMIDAIHDICELSDFHIENRIVLRDKRTGKVWR